MRSVTSRNTPIDQPDFEAVRRMWDEPRIDPRAITEPTAPAMPSGQDGAAAAPVDLDGRIHLHTDAGDVDLIGEHGKLRVEINRNPAGSSVDRFVSAFADPSSPLWPLARALSVSVDLAVDGSRVAFYDPSSPDVDAPARAPGSDLRPGTDRRLDADEPYGDWTYVDPTQLPPEARGAGDAAL